MNSLSQESMAQIYIYIRTVLCVGSAFTTRYTDEPVPNMLKPPNIKTPPQLETLVFGVVVNAVLP